MEAKPTFVFENDRVYAIVESKVIASGIDIESVEAALANPEDSMKSATHIVTPNGLKGQILGRHEDVWGDTVTVRFENGRIASFHTAAVDMEWVKETAANDTRISHLEELLDAEITNFTHSSLRGRLAELDTIEREARGMLLNGAEYGEQIQLDTLIQASIKQSEEINEALADLADVQASEVEESPFSMTPVEQASMGGHNSSWLDHTVAGMIAEAEAQDWNRLMDEGPELLVADMDDAAVADASGVRQAASAFVRTKTAGIERDSVERFEAAFLARAEEVRRTELATRKEAAKTTIKEASAGMDDDGPADALFM